MSGVPLSYRTLWICMHGHVSYELPPPPPLAGAERSKARDGGLRLRLHACGSDGLV